MKSITVKNLYKETNKYLNQKITFEGWVKTVRGSKSFGFIEINDGTFFNNVQIVYTDKLENFEEISKLTISSSIKVTGLLVETQN